MRLRVYFILAGRMTKYMWYAVLKDNEIYVTHTECRYSDMLHAHISTLQKKLHVGLLVVMRSDILTLRTR